ncbi:MAG: PEGA domain-containing protein [Myxococcales bacterium]|nr:PEGA domain-containing protein [Myxococcales bacterium]
MRLRSRGAEAKMSLDFSRADKRAFVLGIALVTACSAVYAAPTSAAAAGAMEPTALDRDTARTLIQQGDEKLKRGDTLGALEAYRRGDSIMRVPTTAIEVAKLELGEDNLVGALEAFRRAANHPVAAREPAPFSRARADARAVLAALDARIPRLTIELSGAAFDVEPTISLDGEPSDKTREIAVNPGDHVIIVTAPGYTEARRTVHLDEGERATVSLALRLIPASGSAPLAAPEGTSFWPLAVAGFALAGAGAISGGVTGGISLKDAAELEAGCPEFACSTDYEATLSRSITLAHVATGSFIAAGVGAVLGITGLALSIGAEEEEEEEAPPTSSLTVAPMLGLGNGAVFGIALAWRPTRPQRN